jgi:hypothetical protein
VPDHSQHVICIKDEHVKGEAIKGQCDEKRESREDQERKVTEAETNPPDMEFPTLRESPKKFEHV